MTDHWHRLHRARTRADLARRIASGLFWTVGLLGWVIFCAEAASLWLEMAATP